MGLLAARVSEAAMKLREEINNLVLEALNNEARTGRSVDIVALTTDMAQSLIDIVMAQDEANQAPLLACIMTTLGEEYLRRRGLMSERRKH
jgi:hypothetical protein